MKLFKSVMTAFVIMAAFGAALATNISQQCEGTLYQLIEGSEPFDQPGSLADDQDPASYQPAGTRTIDYDCLTPTEPVCTYYIEADGEIRQCEPGTYTPAQ